MNSKPDNLDSVLPSLVMALQSHQLGEYCAGTHRELCGCGGGWFKGVHVSHGDIREIVKAVASLDKPDQT